MNSNDEPIKGFWCQTSGIYHYFVIGDLTCLCGARDLDDLAGAEEKEKRALRCGSSES
jgi:hypothetical protein